MLTRNVKYHLQFLASLENNDKGFKRVRCSVHFFSVQAAQDANADGGNEGQIVVSPELEWLVMMVIGFEEQPIEVGFVGINFTFIYYQLISNVHF